MKIAAEEEDDVFAGSSQKIIRRTEKFTTLHVVGFTICTVIAGQYYQWQYALAQGFGQFMIGQMIVAFGFINTFLCLAEIWSAVPFSGGMYGLARAMLGFYPGFLIGCCEAFVYITQSAVAALLLGHEVCGAFKISDHYAIIIVFFLYIIAVGLTIQPSNVMLRRSFVICAIVSLVLLFVYLLGSLGWSNFHENASLQRSHCHFSNPDNWFTSMYKFMNLMTVLPKPYAGMQSFTLLSAVTDTPKVTLPRAIIIAVIIIFSVHLFAIFVNASQDGGILFTASILLPMSEGYETMFAITESLRHFTAFLFFPALFASMYAYMLPCGTLLQSLGRTNLLPSFMRLNHNKDHNHGTIVTAILGFSISFVIHFQPQIDLFNLCIIATCFSASASCFCYIKLKNTCPNLERSFVNPLGNIGALISSFIFSLLFVSSSFFQNDYDPIFGIVVIFIILTVYYFVFAVKHQTLCKEEDRVFLLLHVKNFNKHKKRRTNRMAAASRQRAAANAVKSPNESSNSGVSRPHSETSFTANVLSSVNVLKQLKKFNPFAYNVVQPSPQQSVENSNVVKEQSIVDVNSTVENRRPELV